VNGLRELLTGAVPAGICRWQVPGSTRRSDVEDAADTAGWRLYWLAGQDVTSKDEFLELCADTFTFPDWFGHNWDALHDCLTDLTWEEPAAGHLVVYAGWQALAQEDPESFATALEIFAETSDLWQDTDTPMAVLFPVTADQEALADLPLLTSLPLLLSRTNDDFPLLSPFNGYEHRDNAQRRVGGRLHR
jgi:Barstar (barnase inhibitor)